MSNNDNENGDENSDDNDKKKTINIIGTSTRYQFKKVCRNVNIIKYKKNNKVFEKNSDDNLMDILNTEPLLNNDLKHHLNEKLNGYKNQDKLKKIYDESTFIKINEIIEKLKECNMRCLYCDEKLLLFYNVVREMKQWTLDRIDNIYGHTNPNTVISCLKCNLQRKNINKEKFDFTKKLKVVVKKIN